MSVINLRAFANANDVPILLLADMQLEHTATPRLMAIPNIEPALEKCSQALRHARRIGLPVAFARRVSSSAFFNRATPFSRWLDGFEPDRNEMIFEHPNVSCYSCESFAAFMSQNPAGFVMAGFAGEAACLSTMIDAHHRNHKVTYLSDASASHELADLAAADIHRAVNRICRVYGDVSDTSDWIKATLPRNLDTGHNAVG